MVWPQCLQSVLSRDDAGSSCWDCLHSWWSVVRTGTEQTKKTLLLIHLGRRPRPVCVYYAAYSVLHLSVVSALHSRMRTNSKSRRMAAECSFQAAGSVAACVVLLEIEQTRPSASNGETCRCVASADRILSLSRNIGGGRASCILPPI